MFGRQLKLLLWKNWILRKRHWVRTLVEIIWPTLLFAILVGIRKSQSVKNQPECHYAARAMPSAGVYPWMKSIVCDLANPCFKEEVPSEVPGQINYPPDNGGAGLLAPFISLAENPSITSTLAELNQQLTYVNEVGRIVLLSSLNNTVPLTTVYDGDNLNKTLSDLDLGLDVRETLLGSSVLLQQIPQIPLLFAQRSSVCSGTMMEDILILSPLAPLDGAQLSEKLCALDNATLTSLFAYTTSNIQATKVVTEAANAAVASGEVSAGEAIKMVVAVGGAAENLGKLQLLLEPLSSSLTMSSDESSLFNLLFNNTDPGSVFNDFCGHPTDQVNPFTEVRNFFATEISFGDQLNISQTLDMMDTVLESTSSSGRNGNFCTALINFFEKNDQTRVFWDTFKPLLLGKITYAPDTPLTREIVAKANASFEAIAHLADFGTSWSLDIGPALYETLENGTVVENFRSTLEFLLSNDSLATILLPIVNSGGQVSRSQLVALSNFLSNDDSDPQTWKRAYDNVNRAIVILTRVLSCVQLNKFEGYADEPNLVNASVALVDSKTLWAGIVFDVTESDTKLPDLVKYKIRQDATISSKTNVIQSFYWEPGSNDDETYYYSTGFVAAQDIIERAVTAVMAQERGSVDPDRYRGVYLQELPYPCYTRDEFLEYLSNLLSLLITLAWVYSVCIIVKTIVYEKEQRLKEVMKMMGLSNGVHWVAWFVNAFSLMFISILLLIFIMRVGSVTPYSNLFILLLWLSVFAFATISQCFLISCFFSRANLAAACAGIIYFVLYIPYNMVFTFNDKMTFGSKIIACLLSSVSFGYGAQYVSSYEMSGVGIQFSNWDKSADPRDDMNFLISLVMMFADGVIYLLLMWYVENVFPGTYGVPRPWYFFVTRSYWCGASRSGTSSYHDNDDLSWDASILEGEGVKMEEEPRDLNLGVCIERLSKIYDNGKQALDGLSLNFYEGQITSFLGHNGAGKTTTMSILTGLFPASSGTARIYGDDIRYDMDEIRNKLGFCPQHNVLFGDLTVFEHLELYAGLKMAVGGGKSRIDYIEIEKMIDDVGLVSKRDQMSRNLSGGMKRKLSVAVAFVGGSKCVILDEPTAGVDPYARRGIWDLLLKMKKSRTIMLSTHHMDEADLLGDRIAIISQGRLKCVGSSLYLKSCYGIGYYLTMGKKAKAAGARTIPTASDYVEPFSDDGFESEAHSFSSSSTAAAAATGVTDVKKTNIEVSSEGRGLYRTVLSIVPGAKLHEENNRELTFILPYESVGEKFTTLLSKLDELGIGYGVTDTSLEEIFLGVAENPDQEENLQSPSCCSCFGTRMRRAHSINSVGPHVTTTGRPASGGSHNNQAFADNGNQHSVNGNPEEEDEEELGKFDSTHSAGSYRVTGRPLVWQQFKALFTKRFHYARRNRKGIVAQIIVPACFVALALIFTLIVPDVADYPALELQPWMYGEQNVFFSNDDPSDAYASDVTDALLASPGIGTRCVPGHKILNWDQTLIDCPGVSPSAWEIDSNVRGLSKFDGDEETAVCKCTDGGSRVLLAECERGTDGTGTPWQETVWTGDSMYNMTGRNTSDWLVKTVDLFIQERYGGLSLGETYHPWLNQTELEAVVQVIASLLNTTYNGSLINDYETFVRTENSKVWFDNTGYHSMPTWLNVLNNAALRAMMPTSAEKVGIVAMNHPLNLTKTNIDLAALTQSATNTLVALSIVFALSFVPASFVLFLIEERISKAKHLQFISGVNPVVYWTANFIWDLLNYTVPAFITVLIFLCFGTDAYVSKANLPCLIVILLLYGFAVTPMMYPASFYFEVPSTAYVVLTCVNLFIGINTSIATFILEALDDENLTRINTVYLKKVFLCFPQYCLGRGLIDMAINQAYADAYKQFGVDSFTNPFTFTLVGRNMMALAIEGVVFYIIALLFQYNFFIKPGHVFGRGVAREISERRDAAEGEDDDVMVEKARVAGSLNGAEVLQVRKLTKIYKKRGSKKPLIAVNSMSVGVPEGECFGLLGVNGAGKTTTFQMLTGDTTPSGGDASVCGYSVVSGLHDVQQHTGYCPQFEALSSMLTGFEHLELYARLRGVPRIDVAKVASWAVKSFGLTHYANKPAGTYSGGNKRKLSAAIAFIGKPSVVFLDEPTAGMDPLSRRFLWSRIGEAVKEGQCVVLTSHSMEECEALCTRLAIMVNGKFRCIGTSQHLKNKYGKGYTFSLKVLGDGEAVATVQRFIAKTFPSAFLKEMHCNLLVYQLPMEQMRLSDLFGTLEKNKKLLNIEDYSISQTTLDEVFVGFAKLQTDGSDVHSRRNSKAYENPEMAAVNIPDASVSKTSPPIALDELSPSSRKCGVM